MSPTTETPTPVQYLESVRYEYESVERPYGVTGPLISLAGHFWSERDDALVGMSDLPHDERLCDASLALCTGDGFRWMPDLPALRFP